MARIRIRNKQTGQTGTMDEREFDPTVFELIGEDKPIEKAQTSPTTQTAPTEQTQSLAGKLAKGGGNLLYDLLSPIRFANTGLVQAPILAATKGKVNTRDIPLLGKVYGSSEEELAKMGGGDKPLGERATKTGIEAAKQAAEAASYAIPFGKGANILQKTLLPGALSGGLQGVSAENATPGSTLISSLLGLGSAGILSKLPGANKAVQEVGTKESGKLTKAVQGFGESAAARVTKASPSAFQNAAEYGIDLNKLIAKYTPKKGAVLEDFVGDIASKGRGGIIRKEIQNAEKVIQNRLSKSGNKIVSSTDDIISPLNDIRSKISRLPGESDKIANLDDFINSTRELYPDGFTAKELLDLKRAFDERFGQSIIEEGKGAVTTQAQKVITNKAREVLKKEFPDIRAALDTESELYTLRPVMNRARAIDKTQGSTIRRGSLAALDLTKPGTVTDLVTENPRVSTLLSKLQNFEGLKMPGGSQLNSILTAGRSPTAQKAGALTTSIGANIAPQQAEQLDVTQQTPQTPQTTPRTQEQQPLMTKDELALLTLLDPKNASAYKSIYELSGGEGGGTEAEKAAKAASTLAGDALKLLQSKNIKTGLLNAPIQGGLAKIGAADQDTLEFNTLIAGLKASIAKARAGTSFTPNEEKLLNQYVPVVGDSKQQLETKLKILQTPQGQSVLNVLMNPDSQSQNQNPVDVLQNAGINLQ